MTPPNERVVRFVQLAPIVMKDQAKQDVCILYGLDASGAAWVRSATTPWQRVEQPNDFDGNPPTNWTRGKGSA